VVIREFVLVQGRFLNREDMTDAFRVWWKLPELLTN